MSRLLPVLIALSAAGSLVAGEQMLLPRFSFWRYLDNGSNQGTGWSAAAFDDSSWSTGQGPLGYGDPMTTTIGYGPNASNKYITTYFRAGFNAPDPSAFTGLKFRIRRDDGVVVYLNNSEVVRSNMPAGAMGHLTLASATVGGTNETAYFEFTVPVTSLVQGGNVLAVEAHQSAVTSSDLGFDLELVGLNTEPGITRGPYLQMGAPTSMTVRWRTDIASASKVWFGTSVANLDQSVTDNTSTTEHIVTLNGLSPGTTYFYAAGTDTTQLAGDATHRFTTPPPPGTVQPVRLWIIGDSGTGNAAAVSVFNAYKNFAAASHDADLWLMLGDNAYNNGTDSEYQSTVFNIYPDALRKLPLWPTIGNHDAATPAVYFNIFSLPSGGEAGGLASGTENYYSFDHADIHFICLDSHISDRSTGGPMLTWLANDLAATTQHWIIAFFHHPPYTKGSHNSDDAADSGGRLRDMRENALPILEAGGVDLVLTGHSHSYERSHFLDGHYDVSATLTEAMKLDSGGGREDGNGAYQKPMAAGHQGAVYAVAGSSGQISGGALNHPAMFISLNELGSMIIDVSRNRLDAKFLNSNGSATDHFTILKGSTITVAATDNQAGEWGADQVAAFTLARTGATKLPVNVNYTMSGSASNGTDYQMPGGPAAFASDETSKVLQLEVTADPFAEGTETAQLSLSPSPSYLLEAPSVAASFILDTPADDWRHTWFGGNTPGSADDDDPDHDDMVNLLEYFFGSPPTAWPAGPVTSSPGAEGELEMIHARSLGAIDLASSYEWSTDLASWHANGASDGARTVTVSESVISAPNADPQTIRATAASTAPAPPRLFLRLKIQR